MESGNGGTELEMLKESEMEDVEMEMKIKKRNEMAGKNGKVNEKSKWKNW